MIRDKDKLQDRSNYVKKVVAQSISTQNAVERLAKKLFISERTVYRDLVK